MKKLFLMAVAAVAMLATSCSKDDTNAVAGGEKSTVTFSVEAPVMVTRADLGDGTTATDLSWAVYAEDGTLLPKLGGSKENAFDSELKANVKIDLVNGKEYQVVFWAGAKGAPYTVDFATKTMTVNDPLAANQEKYDAFYKYQEVATVNGARTETIELTRPFAQLNIATADTAKAADGGLVVKQTKVVVPVYKTLNLKDGSVANEVERVYDFADIFAGKKINGYDLLSMNYLLVNAKELETVKFTVKNDDGTFEQEYTYHNVPLQRNYKTNIIGNILTSTLDFEITIDPIFEKPDYESTGFVGAKVGGKVYQTLAEAIANAYDGDVIELSKDEFEFPTQISTKGTRAAERFLTFAGQGDETVISFSSKAGGADGGLNCYADGLSLKFRDLKVVSPNTGSAYSGGFGRAKSIEFNNCTYVGQYRSHGYTKWEDCTIDPQTSYIYTDAVNVDFINCKFNSSEGKGIQVYSDYNNFSSTINVIGCEFVAAKQGLTGGGRPVSAIDINSQGEKFTVNIDEDTTAEGYGPGDYSGNGLWNIKGGVEHITVMVNGKLAAISAGTDKKLESALKENKEYISIELTADTTVDVAAWENGAFGGDKTKSITIEGKGHTLTFNQTNSDWNNITVANGAKLIIKNATLTNAGHNDGPWNRHDLNFACDVELDNVFSDKAIALKAGGKLNKVTINDKNTSDTYALWIQPNGQTVTLTGCTIDMLECTDGRGIKIDEQYVSAPEKVILNVSNTVFKTEEKAAILVKSKAGAEINVSEINITAVEADKEFAVWVDEASKAYAAKVVVNGAKVIVEGTVVAKAATAEEITSAITSANDKPVIVKLAAGSYVVPAAAKGKMVTFVGTENPGDVEVAVTKVGNGGENCDYGLDGSNATFENITIITNSSTYIGYARCNGTYKNCIINGTYTLYGNSVFEDCTFNVSGDVYNLWTWGAPTATFTRCTFNSDGKALLLYGMVNTKLTVNNCTFNDNRGLTDLKAAIEIGNDYNKSYELFVNETVVNGYEINDKGIVTGTTLWANKNSMPKDKLNVVVDGVDVY